MHLLNSRLESALMNVLDGRPPICKAGAAYTQAHLITQHVINGGDHRSRDQGPDHATVIKGLITGCVIRGLIMQGIIRVAR